MSFKNHGPGGCCCQGSCPFWQDQFDLNGWNVDDYGELMWETETGSLTTFSEQSGALIATRSPTQATAGNINFQGPRILWNAYEGLDWNLNGGYKCSLTINVDYGHVVIGDTHAGLLFDSQTNKAYPVEASQLSLGFARICGEGFDFDPSYPFDVTVYKCDGVDFSYGAIRPDIVQINAGPDRVGNTIDYRFMTDSGQGQWTGKPRTLKLDMWQLVGPNLLTYQEAVSSSVIRAYPAVKPSTPEITKGNRPHAQYRLHDIIFEGIGNLYRNTGFGSQWPVCSLGVASFPNFNEVKDCELAPEWNIDGWINPYQEQKLGMDNSIFGGDAKKELKVTCSGTPSRPIDGEDITGPIQNLSNTAVETLGYGVDVSKSVSVLVPSGMTIYSGELRRRRIHFLPPNYIFIEDMFVMSTVSDEIYIRYYFDIGAAGNREFPFNLTSPFCAEAIVYNPSGATIDAEDAWNALGDREWLLEKT